MEERVTPGITRREGLKGAFKMTNGKEAKFGRVPADVRGAADEIIERLFTNGANEKARRLVLELQDGRNGGGWGKEPVRDLILDVLSDLQQVDDV